MRQKLFTKQIDDMLFKQYAYGNDLSKQKVVAKIFNPYGRGVWYLLNSDPQDPDYIWAIVDLFEPEVGSVSREDLETIKVPPFKLNLERDIYFQPINAQELLNRVMQGERFADGGATDLQIVKSDTQENYLTTQDASPSEYAIKLGHGGNTNKQEWVAIFQRNKGMGNEQKVIQCYGNTKDEAIRDAMMSRSYNGITNDYELVNIYTYSGNLPMMGNGGEMAKTYIVEYEINGVKNTSMYLLYPNDRVENLLPPMAKIISIKEKMANGGVMDKSDFEGLIGLNFQLDLEGGGESSEHKIVDIRVTPPNFRNRDLTLITKDGSEDKIPFEKLDAFLNNDQIDLKDSQGEAYAITLIDLFEPRVVRTQFEEEEFEFGNGGVMRNDYYKIKEVDKEGNISYTYLVKNIASPTPPNAIEISKEEYEKANKFSDGGELKDIEKDAIILSKSYGKIYLLQRQGGGEEGKYVLATEDDLMDEMNSKYNSRFIQLYGNGKKYADGGKIKDQYEGRKPEDVWNNLDKPQRQHFLYDHKHEIEEYRGDEHGDLSSKEIMKAYNSDYSELDKNIRNRFDNHVREGQYGDGGEIGGIDAYEAVFLYVKRGLKQPFREDYLKPIGLHNTDKAKEVEASLKKKGYLNSVGALNELGKNKAKEVNNLLDNVLSRYITMGREYRKEKFESIKEKFSNTMKNGGVTYDDKVTSISKSLMKRKKVSPSVQKDYGKTYSKDEAIDSAKRIAGAMRKKEMSKKKS